MAKFYGPIGFATQTDVGAGVWNDQIVERNYICELIRNSRRLQPADQLNDNINVSNEFSIIADPYANENFHAIRYIEFMGTKWKITNIDASRYPRLILTTGGVYNGEQA